MLDVLSNRKRKNPASYIKQVEDKEAGLCEKVQDLKEKIESGEIYGSEPHCCLFK